MYDHYTWFIFFTKLMLKGTNDNNIIPYGITRVHPGYI